jgi:hypothetical protein
MTNTTGRRSAARSTRILGGLSLAALALITAIISYQHGLEVVHRTGTRGFVAYLVPLVADLMIFASSLALLEAAQQQAPRPGLAVWSLGFGIVATVAMNVASGWHHGYGGALVSALAPVALVLSYETLMGMVRRGRQCAETEQPAAIDGDVAVCPHGVAETREDAAVAAFLHARDCLAEPMSFRRVADAFGIHRDKVAAMVKAVDEPEPEPVPAEPAQQTPNGHLAGVS